MKRITSKGFAAIEMLLVVVVLALVGYVVWAVVSDDDDTTADITTVSKVADFDTSVAETIVPAEANDDLKDLEEAKSVAAEPAEEAEEVDTKNTDNSVVAEGDKDYVGECPIKTSEGRVSFYPSDFDNFNVSYFGDVSVIESDDPTCGILRLQTDNHYSPGAYVMIDIQSKMLTDHIDIVEGDSYRVCSEVRQLTDYTGYFHDFPVNEAKPFFKNFFKDDPERFSVYCTEHVYEAFDNAFGKVREAIMLSLTNNAFSSDELYAPALPIEGEEVQTVDVRRVLFEKIVE